MEECSQSLSESKKVQPNPQNLNHSGKIKLGLMSDEDFAKVYPEAYDLMAFFLDVRDKAGRTPIREDKKLKEIRKQAFKYAYDPGIDQGRLRSCIRWAFSEEKKMDRFWANIPVNKLSTVMSMLSQWEEKNIFTGTKTKDSYLDKYNQ